MARLLKVQGIPRHLSGWSPDKPDHRDIETLERGLVLPSRADVRTILSPVEDQLALGSCTANAATSLMESFMIRSGKQYVDLSRLYLYWSTRTRVEDTPATDDSGCELRDVMKALARYGVCTEASWPYDISKMADTPPPECDMEAAKHKILHYRTATTLFSIKHCLANGYALIGGFSVPQNMISDECAATGVVKLPMPDEQIVGGHAVLFVGYDDTSEMLIFQNSWSTSWGNNGFGYLPYGFVEQGLADDFWCLFAEML